MSNGYCSQAVDDLQMASGSVPRPCIDDNSTTVAQFFARVNAGCVTNLSTNCVTSTSEKDSENITSSSSNCAKSNGLSSTAETTITSNQQPSNYDIIQKYVAEPAITALDRQRFLEWMRAHFGSTYLYPTRQDKEHIANQLNISFSQVNRLLANYRRRQLKYVKMVKNSNGVMWNSSAFHSTKHKKESLDENKSLSFGSNNDENSMNGSMLMLLEEHDNANNSNHSDKENSTTADSTDTSMSSNFSTLISNESSFVQNENFAANRAFMAETTPLYTTNNTTTGSSQSSQKGSGKQSYHRRYVQQSHSQTPNCFVSSNESDADQHIQPTEIGSRKRKESDENNVNELVLSKRVSSSSSEIATEEKPNSETVERDRRIEETISAIRSRVSHKSSQDNKEPFVTPPPSQPPASLLLSPSLDGSTTTTASMLFRVRNHAEQQPSLAASNVYPQPQPQHFTYPPAASPLLHNSSLLMTPPEILPTVAQKCDDTTTVGAKSHQQNLSDVKNYQNSNDQSNQNIVSFMSAFTKQQQENQQHLSNNNKPMLEGIMSAANGITTTGNNYQTGTTLALNQLIGNSAPQQQLKYDNQHGGQWEQTQKLQPASANTAASFSLLLALLQQQQQQQEQQEQHEKQQQEQQKQQQQDANIAAQQTLLLHLTLQKELQLLQQQVIANATAQMQHQQQQQQTQQQQTQVIAPELLQHVQLLLQQNGTAINVDDLDKQLKQQQQLPGSNFLSPPLTHTPLSVADDLNSSSPLSFNLLNVNASRSSPATHVSGRLKLCNTDNNFIERHQTTQPQSHTKYQQQQPADVSNYQPSSNGNTCVSLAEDGCQRNDKNSIIVSRYDDLDAFERAIAQRHGDLTDRESLAVAVLAAGLTAARN